MPCEMCGKAYSGCRPAMIDGVKMLLCPECMKYGTALKPSSQGSIRSNKPSLPGQIPRPRAQKDVFKQMGKDLVSNWSKVIQEAREKKGLTREELGFRIGERTVTISKLENGDLRPADKMIEKLEKELGIKLMEEVGEISVQSARSQNAGFTLGDFIKPEEE